MVAYFSRTKTASLNWSIQVKDVADGNIAHSESRESKMEHTNKYVSLISGDKEALPNDVESGTEINSQPFPEDSQMLNQVQQMYLNELTDLIRNRKDYMRNVDKILDR